MTVLGGNTRTHIVTHLLPETHYDLKMQAFNMQVPVVEFHADARSGRLIKLDLSIAGYF